jgi:hypothetical protein
MKKYFLNIFSTILLFTSLIFPQQFSPGSPEWLVDMFFSKTSFPDKAEYFDGEMLNEIDQKTIGEELNGQGEVIFHKVKSTNNENVFAVEVKLENKIIDFYSYLKKEDDQWKINAVRRFLLPSFIYTVRDSLARLNLLSPKDSTFYLSLKLFTMNDSDLIKYFKVNLNKFQKLVNSFNSSLSDEVTKDLGSVACNAIYNDKKYPGCIFIQILKFESMESGFIQSANSVLLPEISVEKYIYIDEISPGWYIYRVM